MLVDRECPENVRRFCKWSEFFLFSVCLFVFFGGFLPFFLFSFQNNNSSNKSKGFRTLFLSSREEDRQCYYECSPDLGPYTKPGFDGFPFLDSIPICADFCDAWFEACRNEFTCAENWLDFSYPDGFNFTQGIDN